MGECFQKVRQVRQGDAVLNGSRLSTGEDGLDPPFEIGTHGAHAVVLNQKVGEEGEKDEDRDQQKFPIRLGCGRVGWDGGRGPRTARLERRAHGSSLPSAARPGAAPTESAACGW